MARRAGIAILIIVTVAPAVGLMVNIANPAEHNYYVPMAVLLVVGLFCLWVARLSVPVGLGIYGSLSLLGLLLMFCEHAETGGNWSSWVFIPVLGIPIIACFIRSATATLGQSGIVILGNLLTGVAYDNLSGVFALWLTTSIVTIVALQMCQDKNEAVNWIGAIWARWRLARSECERLEQAMEKLMDGPN